MSKLTATSAASARKPLLEFDLFSEIGFLQLAGNRQAGRSARTLLKQDNFRVVLVSLSAGTCVREHRAAGPISIQGLAGRMRLRTPEWSSDVRTGHLAVLDADVPHEIEALEDSAFLLTLAWPASHT